MPRIRRPSLNHGMAAVASVLSDVSILEVRPRSPMRAAGSGPTTSATGSNNGGTTKPSNPDLPLVISAKKIFKVLRVLDPRADNAHRGKERVLRLNKFRSYVDGRYSPDGTTKPPFREEDVLILFLGTKLDGGDNMYIPGLLRACGTPSSNHSRSGKAELLKKSALPAMDLLRYLVCDLHITEANANSAVFGKVFCTLPPAELRQLRLSLHLAGFGGKREGSREDASRILTHYLLANSISGGTAFSPSDVLDDLLGPPGSEARHGYGGWLLTQTPELRRAAHEAGVVDVLPNKRQVGAVMLVKTNSGDPLTFAKSVMDDIDGPDREGGDETREKERSSAVPAPGAGRSRRLSDQAFGVTSRSLLATADEPHHNQLTGASSSSAAAAASEDDMAVSIKEFAILKSEMAMSRATVEALQTTVGRLSDTVADLLDHTQKKEAQNSRDMDKLKQENAQLLLDVNEMKSKMGLLRISKDSIHGSNANGRRNNTTNTTTSSGRGNRPSFVSAHDSEGSQEGAGFAGMSIRNVFNSMRKEQLPEESDMADAAMSVDSLLWDD